MIRSPRAVRGALASIVLLTLVLTGCSGIPRSGGVHTGRVVPQSDSPAPIFLPSSPEENASQESILRGFIDAASSPENNYGIAREFLTPEAAAAWDADAGATVDAGTGRITTPIDDETMQVAVRPVAEVNARGEYREVNSTAPLPLTYHFVRLDGQWRISKPPNGIVIDRTTFNDVFSSQPIYFFDPSFRYLVPDLRWFPRGATAPTKIVNAVLAGPSPWLAGAVTTAFPPGTKLTADAVQVVSRSAQVDLNSEALAADRVTLQRMKAQLANSLSSGLSVTITVNHNSQEIAEMGEGAPIVNPRADARALILRDGEFGFLGANGGSLTAIDGLSDAVAALNPTAVTLAAGQQYAAVLAADGVYGVAVGEEPRLLDPRAGLVEPSVDPFDQVWSVPADRPAELIVYQSDGNSVAVPTTWPEASSIQSLEVSRDGTRLLVLLRAGSDFSVVVVGIKREDSVPVGLGDPLVLATSKGTPVSATWVDDVTVATLAVEEAGVEQIIALELGGNRIPLEPAPDSVSITGGNTLRDLLALSVGRGLQVQWGSGWQERIDRVDLIATQQGIR